MRKKPELTESDKTLFRDAMRGVKKLGYNKINPPQTPPVQRTKQPREEIDSGTYHFSDFETLEPVTVDDLIQFSRPGLQHKVLRKLRSGQYNTEAVLDLHGKTVEEARTILADFLDHCRHDGIRYVLIIHGKGRSHRQPILKNKLNHWLRQTDQILAFCSAIAKDGSTGALYVLLRR